jgi:hypothetical protein
MVSTQPVTFAVLFAGAILELPSGIEPPFSNPTYGRVAKRYPSKSQAGQYLGTRQDYQGWEFTIRQRHLSESWMNQNWLPMLRAIETWPFFYCWDNDGHQGDTVFAWLRDKQSPPRWINPIHQEFTLSCGGLHEV